MNYIIYDLEFNQRYEKNQRIQSNLPFEIIQIGAIKINEEFEVISKFNKLIKPDIYPTIHPYIENLTKISNSDLYKADNFNLVYEEFLNFIGKEEHILCVWGITDIKELLRNINFYKLSYKKLSKNYIDIQSASSEYFNTPKNSKIGLRNAVEFLSLEEDSQYHNAYNDAYYTFKVFKKLHSKNIKFERKTYSIQNNERNFSNKSRNNSNGKLDIKALFKQFEKMYNKKLTSEEKSMIKLAYIMGKTKQFLIYNKPKE